MRQARIAVIGTGWWATATHLPALQNHPNAEIIALCDVSASRLSAAAVAFGVTRTYTDPRTLLEAERPDAVVVATTHATHFAVARDCLEAGAHVLIEKPMTLFAADARALTETAARCGRSILVGYPWNYAEHARFAKGWVTSGRLGAVQFVNCVFNSYNADLIGGRDRSASPDHYPVHGPGDVYSRREHSGGGHGHLQITHAAGLLFFVAGIRARNVTARMANHGLSLDLIDVIMVEFDGGGLGMVGGTSNAAIPGLHLHIGCEQGSVEMDMFAGMATARRFDGNREKSGPHSGTYMRFAPVTNLIGIALGTEPPMSTADVGWRAVELLDAAYRSAEEGGRSVPVDELYPPAIP